MVMDVTNWDEDAYRSTILHEREFQYRTVFRAIFVPSSNPNPKSYSDIVVSASSDGLVAAYSLSAVLSSRENSNGIWSPQQVLAAEPTCFLQAHEGPAYDVKFYGDGADAMLLSCGDDGRIRGWKWKELEESETPIHEQGSHVKPVIDLINPQHSGPWYAMSPISENNAIAVDYQGGSIFAAAGDSCAYCWDVETSKIKMVFKGHLDYLHCIVSCKGSNQIITGSEDGTARIWDCRSGKCAQLISPDRNKSLKELSSVSCIALDASESWLAFGCGQSLSVWNLLASEQISRICTPTTCQDVVFDDNNVLCRPPELNHASTSFLASHIGVGLFCFGGESLLSFTLILAVGASPMLSRMDMNGKLLSQIRCAPESAFSVSLDQSGVAAVAGYGGLVDVISQFGSHLCTFQTTSV